MAIGSYALGSVAICGKPSGVAEISTGKVEVTIENEVVGHLHGSILISDQLGGRSTMKFRLFEPSSTPSASAVDGGYWPSGYFSSGYWPQGYWTHTNEMAVYTRRWDVGLEVAVRWNGYLFFGGTIDSFKETLEDGITYGIFSEYTCVDWMQLADRFYVSAAYENKTLSQIVYDLVTVQTPMVEEGVVLGDVDNGPTITKATFNRRKLSEVFRDLAELSGLAWKITPARVLNFFDRATFTAAFDIGDGASLLYRRVQFSRSRAQYRNREIFRAGKGLTDDREEFFRGDGTNVEPDKRRRTFNTAYPVGTAPTIIRQLGAEAPVAQRVGIKGKDVDGITTDPSFKQWFYQYDSNEISQNSKNDEGEDEVEGENPTLTSDEVLTIRYKGLYPVVSFETDDAEVAARAAIEGGSGLYEFLDEDDTIDGAEAAADRSLSYLRIYGRIPGTLDYETDSPGLVVGALQTVAIAEHSISATQYMIDSLKLTFYDDDSPRFNVHALDGERQQGWFEFWNAMASRGRKFTVRENEVVEKSVRTFEELSMTDTFHDSVNDSVTLAAYTVDPFTVWTFAAPVTVPGSGEVIGMARIGRSRWGVPYG